MFLLLDNVGTVIHNETDLTYFILIQSISVMVSSKSKEATNHNILAYPFACLFYKVGQCKASATIELRRKGLGSSSKPKKLQWQN